MSIKLGILVTLLTSVFICLVQQFVLIQNVILNLAVDEYVYYPDDNVEATAMTNFKPSFKVVLKKEEHEETEETKLLKEQTKTNIRKNTDVGGTTSNDKEKTVPPPPPPKEMTTKTMTTAPMPVIEKSEVDVAVVVEDDLASNILIGKELLPDNKQEVKFTPGSLKDISMKDVLGHCYADVDVYKNHFYYQKKTPYSQRMVSISTQHKLMYILIEKSGSSTNRFMMEKRFNSDSGQLKREDDIQTFRHENNYTAFTFLREPLSRFWSSYEEAYFRTGPWFVGGPYYNFTQPHPYPYLHEGLRTFDDYQDVWCPPHTLPKNPWNPGRICAERQTRENGTLAERLERYVKDTDGRSPMDFHLKLQVPLLSNPQTGLVIDLDDFYNVKDITDVWEEISKSKGLNLSEPIDKDNFMTKEDTIGVIKGRSYPRRFDKSRISNETKQRICEHVLLDYCCLNIPLPPPCENLYCKLNQHHHDDDGEGGKDGKKKNRLQIQPWTFPA